MRQPQSSTESNFQVMNCHDQLESLTQAAKARMAQCNPGIAGVMGGAEIDFMTPEEKELRHKLLLSLPGSAQLRQEARERIAIRIKQRRRGQLASVEHAEGMQ
jgi:hypothetical protein